MLKTIFYKIFPKTSSWIAKGIVRTGLALVGGSLILDAVNWQWTKTYGEPLLDTSFNPLYGIILLLIGTIYSHAIEKIEAEKISGKVNEQDKIKNSHDLKIYNRFMEILPSTGSMQMVKEYSFLGSAFIYSRIDQLHDFIAECDKQDFIFLDDEFENKRNLFATEVKKFVWMIGINGVYKKDNSGIFIMKKDYEYTSFQIFHDKQAEINGFQDEIMRLYIEIIRKGKQIGG